MSSDPTIVDRIKPFIRKLEGSIEQARRERMLREGEPLSTGVNGGAGSAAQKSAASLSSQAPRPGAGHSFIGGGGGGGGATRPAAAPPASSTPSSTPSSNESNSSDPRKAIPRGMQARPLVRRTTI